MTTYSEFSFDSGNERARLISLEHVVITRSTYLKCGVVWKMSDWADLAEASGDYVMIADTFHPHPLDPPKHKYKYFHKQKNAVVLSTQNGLKIITKRTFFPSVAAWTETLQDGGKLTISLPKKRDIICMAPRHHGYCKYI